MAIVNIPPVSVGQQQGQSGPVTLRGRGTPLATGLFCSPEWAASQHDWLQDASCCRGKAHFHLSQLRSSGKPTPGWVRGAGALLEKRVWSPKGQGVDPEGRASRAPRKGEREGGASTCCTILKELLGLRVKAVTQRCDCWGLSVSRAPAAAALGGLSGTPTWPLDPCFVLN